MTLPAFTLKIKAIPQTGGGSVTIERTDTTDIATVVAPSTFAVPDSDVVLKDSADNVLRTVSVMADSSVDETIGDVTVQLKDSAGTDIGAVNNYLAESANNLTAPDATAVIKDGANNTLQIVNIPSNASQNVSVGNTIVQLKDSVGNDIGSPDSYLAESTNNKTAPDATVTLNGNAFLSPRSNQTIAATLTDEDNVQIPYTQVSNQVKVDMYLYVDPFWETVRDLTFTGNYNNLIL